MKKKPSQKRTGARKPTISPPVKPAGTPVSTKAAKRPKSKKSTTPSLPKSDPNDLNAINRKLAERRIRIEEQQRRSAADTGAGRIRLGKLQAHRRRLANRAAAFKAERASSN
ncbi:hypothetical protein [Prescottella soli]